MTSSPEIKTLSPAPLELQTQQPETVVRDLGPDDDQAYFDLVQRNAAHLLDGGLYLGQMYSSPEKVAEHRQDKGARRMGIWNEGSLVGGVDIVDHASNDNDAPISEVSYWLDDETTGKGIARAAVDTVTAYYNQQGIDIKAEVEPGNYLSRRLLGKLGFRLLGYDEDEGRDIFVHAAPAQPAVPLRSHPNSSNHHAA